GIYLAMGLVEAQPREALAVAAKATKLARESSLAMGLASGLIAEAAALKALGRPVEVLAKSTESIGLVDHHGLVEGAEEIAFIHSRLLKEAGALDAAKGFLVRAYDGVAKKVKRLRDPHLRRCFLSIKPQAEIIAAYQRETPHE